MLFVLLVIRPFMTFFIGLRVRGREHLPQSDPFILVANHSSHLDGVSLLSLFPLTRLRNIRGVAAADYFERNRFIAGLTRTFFNILPIVRHKTPTSGDPCLDMLAALEAGQSLIIFPEGTRGSGDQMGPFRYGVAKLVEAMPDVPVVPAYLLNMGRCLPKGSYVPVPLICEVRLGAPRLFHDTREGIVKTLEAAVRELGGLS
jgi:1-acyl-sn-glycerol-3-phosphate acyltransferase